MRALPWAASLALLALSACATGGKPPPPVHTALTPTERYAIEVRQAPVELKLAAHESGLSEAQAAALTTFVGDWRDAGGGEITLKTPEHGPDPSAAYKTANDARDFLVSHGVSEAGVQIEGYEANGDSHAPLLIGFMRYIAKGPQCGRSWSDLSSVDANVEYPEFGCAVTADMAAQIANPGDLVAPQTVESADPNRRVTVIDTYRKGAVTSTPKDPQADGTLATVGQ